MRVESYSSSVFRSEGQVGNSARPGLNGDYHLTWNEDAIWLHDSYSFAEHTQFGDLDWVTVRPYAQNELKNYQRF